MAQSKDKGAGKRPYTKSKQKEDQPAETHVVSTFIVALVIAALFAVGAFLVSLNHKVFGLTVFYFALISCCGVILFYLRHVRHILIYFAFAALACTLFFIYLAASITRERVEQIISEATPIPTQTPPYIIDGKVITPTPAPPRKLSDGRIVVDMSPEDIEDIFDKNTDIQARKLVEPYIDKWMLTSGTVRNVANRKDGKSFVVLGRNADKFKYVATVALFTDPKEIERVQLLKRGDTIKIAGQIKFDEKQPALYLDNCEFIDE